MDSDFEKTLEMLREAHREPIPEAHFAAVRARVLAQIVAERRPWWRGVWAYGFAAAIAAAMLLAAVWPKTTVVKPAPVVVATTQLAKPLTGGRVPDRGVHAVRAVHKRKRMPRISAAAYRVIGPPNPQPLVVKVVTNDPNVVIYWISGE